MYSKHLQFYSILWISTNKQEFEMEKKEALARTNNCEYLTQTGQCMKAFLSIISFNPYNKLRDYWIVNLICR